MTKAATTSTRPDPISTRQTPAVGRVVHYYDREEIVNADGQKRPPEPFSARITRVNRDQDGEVLDVVTLAVDDPEIGNQIRRDVAMGEDPSTPEAHRWYWPAYVPARGMSATNRLAIDPPPAAPTTDTGGDAAAAGK